MVYVTEIILQPLTDAGPTEQAGDPEVGKQELIACNYDWNTAKKKYATDTKFTAFHMRSVGAFREQEVVQRLEDLRQRYHAGGAKVKFLVCGSDNLTSDFDVTVGAMSGDVRQIDVDLVNRFNEEFLSSTGFGGNPSGVVFDTNLYVGEYLPVRESLATKGLLHSANAGIADQVRRTYLASQAKQTSDKLTDLQETGFQPDFFWGGMSQADFRPTSPDAWNVAIRAQDIFAFTKLRRYADAVQWDCYRQELRERLGSGPLLEDLERRLDTADALVNRFASEVLTGLGQALRANETTDSLLIKVDVADTRDASRVMNVRNALYTRYTLSARRKLRTYRNANPGELNLDNQAQFDAYMEAMGEFCLALMFAMEAYHSGSAIFDVVGVQQARLHEPEEMHRDEFLVTFTEQLGDFLKDMRHYRNSAGNAYIQSSKYVQRMCRAAQWALRKTGNLDFDMKEGLCVLGELTGPESDLIQMRKPAPKFDGRDWSQKRREDHAVELVRAKLELNNPDAYARWVIKLNARLNSACRKVPIPRSHRV
ncbi:hypothetical protein AB8O64_35550 (plasmid) [Streptomyces sp. QH1-20]|uniref:hypothetical protein n=1 Tax=Streptomyces sp. QH1-20 TaxID=3240934 RepID=UPI003517EE5C